MIYGCFGGMETKAEQLIYLLLEKVFITGDSPAYTLSQAHHS
jgi:hypothetical protein